MTVGRQPLKKKSTRECDPVNIHFIKEKEWLGELLTFDVVGQSPEVYSI